MDHKDREAIFTAIWMDYRRSGKADYVTRRDQFEESRPSKPDYEEVKSLVSSGAHKQGAGLIYVSTQKNDKTVIPTHRKAASV